MNESISRINAMILRYLYLHKRSVSRTLEVIFWPVMELLVWGFLTLYIQSLAQTEVSKIIIFLINAMIFWDVLYRSQQGVSISIVEDIWTQNIVNLLVSPLKIWEWLTATFIYGAGKILMITAILAVIAFGLYHFNLVGMNGFYLIPLMANLLFFGWAMGVFTSGLLIRWGHAVEALIWGIPFLVQPISAIFYPLSVLPPPVQVVSRLLPSTYVF
ncbi:MAG: ABC transporter permease, partial [Deltaproteobacteria bacterium]|nr:ABC transporter permease [Deltaproteobacteria bacterium]